MSRKSRVLLLGSLTSLAGYLALAVFAAQQELFAVDYGTRTWVKLLKYQALDAPFGWVTELGDVAGLVPALLFAIVVLWRVHRRWAIALPMLMVGAWAIQRLAKWAVHRDRPNLDPWGFPSGHVLSLVVFFGLMIWLIATASKRRRRWRVLASLLCVATVTVVAFSRLYLDKHWLSDLAGGLMVGLAYLLFAIWIVEVVWTAYSAHRAAQRASAPSPTTETPEGAHEDDRTASVPVGSGVGVGGGRAAADRAGAGEAQSR
jgi:undecaprenyl-diphosphatase